MSERPSRLVRLTARDAEVLWARLRSDVPANIFPIADLEHFGWESPNLRFDGIFRGDELTGHLMRYGTNGSFAYDHRDDARLVERWLRHNRIAYVNGLARYVAPVLDRLRPGEVVRLEESYLARLEPDRFRPETLRASPGQSRRATLEDLDGATRTHIAAPDEFAQLDYGTRREMLRATLTDGWRRLFVGVTPYGKIVSAAQTSAEAETLAVIGGVVTDPAYRGQGYGKACTAALCAELLAEGKIPYLFYRKSNEPAARVYAAIGFELIDDWILAEVRL